jgi:type I restriction enzyme S subunit
VSGEKQSERAGALRRYKPYPAYKDSGVEWLGEIPAHWEVARISELATLLNGYPFDSEFFTRGEGAPLVRIRDLNAEETEVNYVGPVVESAWIEAGDVIIGMDGDFNVARWRGRRALLNQRMCCLRPRGGTDSGFIAYLLPLPLRIINDLTYSTTVKHLSSGDVLKVRLGAPPEPEQRAIAAFLDRETARIDALVAKKERLIELLQEQRTALITRAVTKGLDPTVPLKDSGVEWLGEIPAHWEVKPIRALAKPGYKTFTDGDWIESPYIRDEGIRLIQTGNVGIGEYKEQGFRYIDEETFRAFRCTEVLPGDVLICRLADPVGRACLAPNLGCRMITSVDVCILKPATDVHAAFVVYALTGSEYLAWLSGICRGGTRDRVSRSMLGAIRVQKPPLSEQRAIAAFLDRETARIDALVAKVREAIERLKELRTALISAAVTGKIDVREEVSA